MFGWAAETDAWWADETDAWWAAETNAWWPIFVGKWATKRWSRRPIRDIRYVPSGTLF